MADPAPLQRPRDFIRPTGSTRFLRTFPPWQLWRFVVINVRMTIMILRSHDTKLGPRR